jgi:outer membrane phospholipase A
VDLTLGAGLPTGTYAVLAWRAVPQFSSFGSHIGNSATDGGFAAMDFAPALVLAKNASAGSSYHTVQDIARSPINPVDNRLWLSEDGYAETSNGDGTSDFISTGWKTRTTHFGINGSGNTIIHAAWAAVPGKFARAR